MNDSIIPPVRYAGFWKRFWAYGYDSTIITIVAFIFAAFSGDMGTGADIDSLTQNSQALVAQLQSAQNLLDHGNPAFLWDWMTPSFDADALRLMLFSAIYNIFFVCGKWQATPGKRYCGILVVNEDGSKLTVKQSTLRHLASGISMTAGGLGFLTIPFTKQKTALHDMICDTRVVYATPTAII